MFRVKVRVRNVDRSAEAFVTRMHIRRKRHGDTLATLATLDFPNAWVSL